jgi:hypothetical protein
MPTIRKGMKKKRKQTVDLKIEKAKSNVERNRKIASVYTNTVHALLKGV